MSKTIPVYRIGLVMTKSGLNDKQTIFLRKQIRDVQRLASHVTLIVPVITWRECTRGGPEAVRRTRELLQHLKLPEGLLLSIQDIITLEGVMVHMLECDEVWCATAVGLAESQTRPARIHALAQSRREAPRFKFLHYWVELDPDMIPSQTTKRSKALKGY